MWVPDFRKSALYQRSLDLFHEVYRTTEENRESIGEIETMLIRKQVMRITKKNNAFACSAKYQDEI